MSFSVLSTFQVSGNTLTSDYIVFTGKEPNRALGLSSLKPEDCIPEWEDLDEGSKKTLDDWYTFFSKRYNIVGKVQRD